MLAMTDAADASQDLDRDYEGAGFRGRLGWGRRPALLVIDVCHAYVDAGSPLYAGVEDACAAASPSADGAILQGSTLQPRRRRMPPCSARGFSRPPSWAGLRRFGSCT